MNNKIKFRIWDLKHKEFLKDEYSKDPESYNLEQLRFFYKIEDKSAKIDDRYVFRMFSGLKDKNGLEIYDGDVIFADGDTWEVIFDMGGFFVRANKGDKLTPLYQYPDCMLVGHKVDFKL